MLRHIHSLFLLENNNAPTEVAGYDCGNQLEPLTQMQRVKCNVQNVSTLHFAFLILNCFYLNPATFCKI